MDIAIIGAGPVGLYAAALLKHLHPDSHVQVFEKRSEDQFTGFGYTVHSQSLGLLNILHPDVIAGIEQRGTAPFTRRTINYRGKQVDLDPEVCRRTPIIGIEYDSLIQILKTRARANGVELHYEAAITSLDDLARKHDLVIAANGANSEFLQCFDPVQVETGLSYAWGKEEMFSDVMAMSIDTLGAIPFICHKYPISKTTTVLIMEVQKEHEAEAAQRLANDPETRQYFPAGIMFRTIPLCMCREKVYRNIVCIGDAALAQYFAAGAGLYFGLMQTGLLCHVLDTTPGGLEPKLQAYNKHAADCMRYQWEPNKSLIHKKHQLLAEYALMTDEAVLEAMMADE
jgi:2-polyprenyl-6-methoxyphenol hydroxylase-like FAD-dependent oxidoreductase